MDAPELLELAKIKSVTINEEKTFCDRVTAQLSLHHEHCGVDPTSAVCSFYDPCEYEEQPISRRLKVSTRPTVLETAWLEHPGYLVLEHKGEERRITPSLEDATKERQRIVFVCLEAEGKNPIFIRYRRFVAMEISDLKQVTLRTTEGSTIVQVTIMPR